MSLSASVGTQIPTNVIEVGNEISQVAVDAIAASSSPSNVNPMMTASAVAALGYIGDAPSNGSEYVRKNATWSIATGGGLTISSLSNAAATTLNSTAPTTNQALTFDGTELKWATVGGGGGGGGSVAWGGITGTVTDQTDLTSYISGLGYQTATDVSTYVTGLGYQTATDVSTYVTGLGYLTSVPNKTISNYTSSTFLTLAACNNIAYLTGGMGFSVTADNDMNVAYPDGSEITVVVDALSSYSISGGMGVSINGTSSVTLSSYVSKLVKVAANTWYVS